MSSSEPTTTINKQIDGIYEVLAEFRGIHPNITPNAMMAFVNIATNPGITVREVQKKLEVPSSTAVRSVSLLSSTHRSAEGGLDLIRYDTDNNDRRVKHLYLTPKGQHVWASIKRILAIAEG